MTDHPTRVDGRLQDNDAVRVHGVGDNPLVLRREDANHVNEGACSLNAAFPDGTRIEEGSVSQTITFPDGLRIEKGAITTEVSYPDGQTESWDHTDSTEGSSISVSVSGGNVSISTSSTNVEKATDSTETEVSDDVTTDASGTTQIRVSQSNTSTTTTPSAQEFAHDITPSGFVILLVGYGLFVGSDPAIAAGVILYAMSALPTVIKTSVLSSASILEGIKRAVGLDAAAEQPSSADDDESMDPLTKLETEYAEGNLTDAEFEHELEHLLANEYDVEADSELPESLEVEPTTESETA